jgi:uncharacterized repeat protein (TIGR01451 family)
MNNLFALIRRSLFVVPLIALCFFLIPSHAAAQNGDLRVVKSGPASAAAGTDITYDISVTNVATGTSSTPDNVLTDTLPAGTTFVSEMHSSEAWNCLTPMVGSGGTITCTNSNPITDEDVATFTFVVHIDPNATGTISNTATVNQGVEDPTPGNNSSTVMTTISEPPPPPPPPLLAHDVLISEFRLSGPGGNSDEYVELYCNRDIDCDMSGASIRNYNTAAPGDPPGPGDLSSTFPQGVIIPARQYLLIGDSTEYSLSTYGILDFDVHTPSVPDYFNDNQGLQVLSGGDDAIVVDSVGFIGGGDDFQFIEGTGLEPATAARPSFQYAYVRKRTLVTNGLPQDTDNNADDFVLVSVTGTPHPGITAPPVLGAPGPQGLSSALTYSNSEVTWSLVEPDADRSASPNRVRIGSGDSGTISFRRSFTNNTSETFDYIAFRVIEISTLNSPNTLGDQAQLRLITSPNAESFTNSQGRPVSIRGTELEFDPGCGCEPAQPIGGGLNSTVSVNLSDPETEQQIFIGPGQTIDVQFLLDVDRPGNYRFYVYVEAFPASQVCGDCPVIGSPKAARARVKVAPHVPRKLINLKSSPKAVAAVKKPKNSAPIPTKSFTGRSSAPSVTPVRVFVFDRPVTTTNRKRRKLRIRRKASAALRAKAEARDRQDEPQN